MATRYGIISDTHQKQDTIPALVAALRKREIDAMVLNGDIGESPDHIAFTIRNAAETGLPTYVQPGSHEEVAPYMDVMADLKGKYPNIIDCLTDRKHEQKDHHLIFVPGSDVNIRGSAFSISSQLPTGNYLRLETGLAALDDKMLKECLADEGKSKYLFNATNINDLDRLITDAERSIVFCHIPTRAGELETGVDMAYFAQGDDGRILPGVVLEEMIIKDAGDVSPEEMRRIAQENGYMFRLENRGNTSLDAVYSRNGITKAINGHFHESVHRAHGFLGNAVEEGIFTDDLAYMASYADAGAAGIVTVKGEKVSYENLVLD